MADNSEIIVGGGQAVKPDQATIDALVEKLEEKLHAREMAEDMIKELLKKYKESLPRWLTLTHKYITLYPLPTGNADYNRDYTTIYTDEPVFEEVNWSAVDFPEERPDEYRLSRRLSNMYHYTDDPDYKFPDVNTSIEEEELHWVFNEETGEYEQVPRTMIYKADAAGIIDRRDQSTSFRLATYNYNDDIRTIFFLEIVWGYSGWEWKDYERTIGTDPETEEPITETLKGGNLYKIKEIKTVRHIIDGHRLYHINDFLNSQDKVTVVEDFNTTNLIAVNRAYKRLTLRTGLNSITPLTLYPCSYPNVEEADDVFYNNKIIAGNGSIISFPKLVNVDSFYKLGEYTGSFVDETNLKFQLDNLEVFTNGFMWTHFSQPHFNLNEVLVGDSLKKVNNLSGLLENATFYNAEEVEGYDEPVNIITIDLSGSTLTASDEFNLSRLAYWIAYTYSTTRRNSAIAWANRRFVFELTLKGLTNLESAFRRIMNNSYNTSALVSSLYSHGGVSKIKIDFNDTEGLVRNLDYALAQNVFIELPPFNSWLNDYTTENYIYQSCSFNVGVTYDFSPHEVLNPSQGQFNNSYINPNETISFLNVDALQNVRFQNITFGNETITIDEQTVTRPRGIAFPFVGNFHDGTKYQYNEDPTDLHRFINFSGSMFTSVRTLADPQSAVQTIYATSASAASMFNGCTRIDFAGDNIVLDVKVIPTTGQHTTNYVTFQNCSSMTETPEIYMEGLALNTGTYGDVLQNMFNGCTNVKKIHGTHINGHPSSYAPGQAPRHIDFTTCTSLEHLELGDVCGAINIRGITTLNLATLSDTLMRQTSFGAYNNTGTGLWISGTVWTALQTQYPATYAYVWGFYQRQEGEIQIDYNS